MKYSILFLIAIITLACKDAKIIAKQKDNAILKTLYNQDQSDREGDHIDWSIVRPKNKARQVRISELLDSKLLKTSQDYYHAAVIFQNGRDTSALKMAIKMMRKAIELNPSRNKRLLAEVIDQNLLRRGQPQIYGTQFIKGLAEPWKMNRIDTTIVSDTERIKYNVETLAVQRAILKNRNKKKLFSQLIKEGKTINEIIAIAKRENLTTSEYNLSESEINEFGYKLMVEEKNEDALKIFILNTELYPKGSNTYDSLGECLLKLGKKEKALEAYKKSLKLNPKNTNATRIIAEIKK